jgi:hypothetical protein
MLIVFELILSVCTLEVNANLVLLLCVGSLHLEDMEGCALLLCCPTQLRAEGYEGALGLGCGRSQLLEGCNSCKIKLVMLSFVD